jgi:hypothetical protein
MVLVKDTASLEWGVGGGQGLNILGVKGGYGVGEERQGLNILGVKGGFWE